MNRNQPDTDPKPPTRPTDIVIMVNGEEKTVKAGITVDRLLSQLQLEGDRVAVELDRNIVRRSDWNSTSVGAGSSVEVVHFVGGG